MSEIITSEAEFVADAWVAAQETLQAVGSEGEPVTPAETALSRYVIGLVEMIRRTPTLPEGRVWCLNPECVVRTTRGPYHTHLADPTDHIAAMLAERAP